MKLIIGGAGQGKLLYTMRKYGISQQNVAKKFSTACEKPVFDTFQQAVRNALQEGKSPEKELERVILANPEVIIICDEVGCGVVPVQREERIWRETVGRLCCRIAEQADSVERVFCGISMKLK